MRCLARRALERPAARAQHTGAGERPRAPPNSRSPPSLPLFRGGGRTNTTTTMYFRLMSRGNQYVHLSGPAPAPRREGGRARPDRQVAQERHVDGDFCSVSLRAGILSRRTGVASALLITTATSISTTGEEDAATQKRVATGAASPILRSCHDPRGWLVPGVGEEESKGEARKCPSRSASAHPGTKWSEGAGGGSWKKRVEAFRRRWGAGTSPGSRACHRREFVSPDLHTAHPGSSASGIMSEVFAARAKHRR